MPAILDRGGLELAGFFQIAELAFRVVAKNEEGHAGVAVVLERVLEHADIARRIAKGKHRLLTNLDDIAEGLAGLAVFTEELIGADNLVFCLVEGMLVRRFARFHSCP